MRSIQLIHTQFSHESMRTAWSRSAIFQSYEPCDQCSNTGSQHFPGKMLTPFKTKKRRFVPVRKVFQFRQTMWRVRMLKRRRPPSENHILGSEKNFLGKLFNRPHCYVFNFTRKKSSWQKFVCIFRCDSLNLTVKKQTTKTVFWSVWSLEPFLHSRSFRIINGITLIHMSWSIGVRICALVMGGEINVLLCISQFHSFPQTKAIKYVETAFRLAQSLTL